MFWVAAAGKNGRTAARCLDVFLTTITYNNMSPFEAIRNKSSDDNMPDDIIEENFKDYKSMAALMKEAGIGCYSNKSRTFTTLAYSKLNLRTCSASDLEKIHGIGMKTSRCFILHSRKGARLSGLDTHMLKHLREVGVENVPKATPSSKKQYMILEQEVLKLADEAGISPADYDLMVWNKYSSRKK